MALPVTAQMVADKLKHLCDRANGPTIHIQPVMDKVQQLADDSLEVFKTPIVVVKLKELLDHASTGSHVCIYFSLHCSDRSITQSTTQSTTHLSPIRQQRIRRRLAAARPATETRRSQCWLPQSCAAYTKKKRRQRGPPTI